MKLFNTLTQSLEEFIPIDDKTVGMYVCGVTPYDTTHLGHAFTYVSFDTLIRYLEFRGYSVNYVQNVTDIDDDVRPHVVRSARPRSGRLTPRWLRWGPEPHPGSPRGRGEE